MTFARFDFAEMCLFLDLLLFYDSVIDRFCFSVPWKVLVWFISVFYFKVLIQLTTSEVQSQKQQRNIT